MFSPVDDAIDELFHLRHRLYSEGLNHLAIEAQARATVAALPARTRARRETQRAKIDLANALALDTLGGVARVRGEFDPSVMNAGAAEDLYLRLGREYDAERMAISIITVAVQTGHIREAAERLKQTGRRLAGSRSAETRNEIVARRADILVEIGQAAEAVALQRDERLIEQSLRSEDPFLTAGRLFYLARAELNAGEVGGGERRYDEAISLMADSNHAFFRIQGDLTYASLCIASDDEAEAQLALERALATSIAEGISRHEVERALREFRDRG